MTKLLAVLLVFTNHFAGMPSYPFHGNNSATTFKAWKLIKNKEGISVYARKYKNTNHRELKAIAVFKASLSSLVAIIKDDASVPQWINRMKLFQNIHTVSNQQWYTYAEISLPFPYYNRDLISLNTLEQNSDNHIVVIDIESKPNYLPKKRKKVRMKNAEGQWRFKPLGNGKILVSYQFYAEPNLGLPAWIINPLATKGVWNTLKKFREMAKKPKYQQTKLPYISQ
ncbi:START domain-containing protein [Microscilla marina]|uniref:START domain-containing protein n=1 Tax=Microscilla marina ATCC 23134 TaxID=313606 RepID=A1ZP15_MICM2|nr:START domain-containing protein [Microscilla marina]EAY27807.1 conserved hypothetical protein [Microscilla marina ATCC 23134]